ncbi:hypothetical protein FA95DRAFT_1310007 [Auriscalpium vulgare]|uniref:Uncharacterized protein n=1 Tax=Auriscalpium vulgare TaxID=40419 RepID=A0ACB8RTI0_9AGAM|nr:hypothetical protein FA95DRAFT_1310007 [Auriscalpium vulgare]
MRAQTAMPRGNYKSHSTRCHRIHMSNILHHPLVVSAITDSEVPEDVRKLVRRLFELKGAERPHDVPPAVLDVVSLIQDRLKAEARAQTHLGSRASLISHILVGCLNADDLPILPLEREYIALAGHVGFDQSPECLVPLLGIRKFSAMIQSNPPIASELDEEDSLDDSSTPIPGDPDGDIDSSTQLSEKDDVRGYIYYCSPPDPGLFLEARTMQYTVPDSDKLATLEERHRNPNYHLLARVPTTPIAFCDLVLADTGRIHQAVSAALHQRRNLGVGGSVVGFAFSDEPFSHWLHVVVGWLEEAESSVVLPSVHVMHAEFSSTPQTGSFDLTDRGSVFALFEAVRRLHLAEFELEGLKETPAQWRAGGACFPEDAEGFGLNKRAGIGKWAENIEATDTTIPRQEDLLNNHVRDPVILARKLSDEIADFLRADPEFGNDGYLWLMDRGCSLESFLPTFRRNYDNLLAISRNDEKYDQSLINLFQFYDNATRARWPQDWMDSNNIPSTSEELSDCLSVLLTSVESRDKFAGTEEESVVQLLHQQFAPILRASKNTRPFMRPLGSQDASFYSSHEILLEFAARENDNTPLVFCFFNQRIRLPRNDLADGLFATALVPKDREYYVIKKHSRKMYLNIKALERVPGGFNSRRNRTAKQYRELQAKMQHDKHCSVWVSAGDNAAQLRKLRNPPISVCDAILAVQLSLPSVVVERVTSVGLIIVDPAASPPLPAGATPSPKFSASGITKSLLLPLLVVQHGGEYHETDVVGPAKLRMHLTAAVKFLAALDVFDFVVFGVISRGPLAIVPCAWAPRPEVDKPSDPVVQIFERSCRFFDLSTPAGAFDYAAFLAWVRVVHGKALLDRLDGREWDKFLGERGDKFAQWAMGDD